ncbi:MAG: hypothetical protein KatS3mg115_1120 [Candidatus Poribacteria bacterium]|nr:MAG: hypothetical protein KatS3mg115_1120 [Candidatus Poribacteria bacterium]
MTEKIPPRRVQVDRDRAVTITWKDGTTSVYPIAYLRQHCPCATCQEQREEATNPLRVLPSGTPVPEELTIAHVEPVGHYALRFRFSDGHAGGIYSWEYLLKIAPPTEGESSS